MTRRWLRRPRLCGHAWARLHVRASSTEKRIGSVGSLASTAPFSRPSRSPLLPWFPGCPSAPPGRVCLVSRWREPGRAPAACFPIPAWPRRPAAAWRRPWGTGLAVLACGDVPEPLRGRGLASAGLVPAFPPPRSSSGRSAAVTRTAQAPRPPPGLPGPHVPAHSARPRSLSEGLHVGEALPSFY